MAMSDALNQGNWVDQLDPCLQDFADQFECEEDFDEYMEGAAESRQGLLVGLPRRRGRPLLRIITKRRSASRDSGPVPPKARSICGNKP